MANINVSVAASNVSVTETVSNIIITDAANVIIGNITTTQSNISVTSTPSVINVGTGPIPTPVTNAEIRAGVSANAPILYNESTGVFSLDSNASFIGKTTDNLPQGTTNLYFTTALARQSISGSGDISYDANTGVISYTGTPGDITDVIAGAGLTGGGSSGNVTLNVGAGTGITVNADNIAVNMSAFTTTDLVEGANLYYTTTRANTAIDTRVNKAFVEGLGVSYTSLTDKPVIPTHTSNLVNDSGFITTANANVISVNGETGVVSLDTTDIPEGANLYYTTTRANTAIDARVNKAYVEALGISYTSLANAPTNVSFFTNDAGYLVAANLASLTANVVSVNGQTGVVSLTTTNIAEGANLYYTTDRANTAIGAYQGTINTAGNITTSANVSGQYILGNGAFLTGIASAGTVTQINTGENLTGGPITTTGTIGMANTLANVNSISSESLSNLTLATNKEVGITTVQRNGDIANSANIHGEGFALTQSGAFFDAPFISYSGADQLKTYVFDASITAGSNVITVTAIYDLQGVSANVSDVAQYYVYTDEPLIDFATSFPPGTYVTGVSGNNIYMSANATITDTFFYDGGDPYISYGALTPGARDNTTGVLIALESDYDDGGANAQLITFNFMTDKKSYYAYGPNGPVTTNFNYSRGTASDYSIDTGILSKFMFARTDFSANQTVGNFRRGLTVGDADLTNRGENDGLQTFGLNIVWDGTANVEQEYGSTTGIFPQLLLKQYTNGTNQGIGGNTSVSWSGGGPRLMFIGAYGKNTDAPLSTYARANQELGRISWLTTTAVTTGPSTVGPPAYISAISLKDQTTGPGDVGLYLVASPTTSGTSTSQVGGSTARALFLGHHKGNTIISAASRTNGTCGDIMFTPARAASNRGNAAQMAEQVSTSTVGAAQWARIGYDNPSANTGARVEVTNGFNSAAARNGNLSVIINRNDNGVGFGNKAWALKLQSGSNDLVVTEDNVIRTTFEGANIIATGNVTASTFLGNISGTTGTFTANVIADNTVVNGVAFNTAGTTSPSSGQIVYNAAYGGHEQGLDGSNVIVMGQDIVAYVHNSEANTLSKGEVVYIFGAVGDKASVKRAVNTTDASSSKTLGIVKSDIVTGGTGYVVTQGVANGLNLGAYTEGDSLYLANVAGTFTNVKPQAPEHIVFIGVVEKANAGNGQIYVRVQNGFELDEIHDIKLANVQQNDMLIRNVGNSLWVNQSVSSVVANTNVTLKQFSETRVALGNVTGDQSSNINLANGSIFTMTATGNITISSVTNAVAGSSATLIITQDGMGNKLLTSTMKFAGASKTLSTAAGAIDIVSLFYDGTTYYATLSKGYA